MSVIAEDKWTRDVAKMIIGWLIGTAVAIVLLLTVIKWFFIAGF